MKGLSWAAEEPGRGASLCTAAVWGLCPSRRDEREGGLDEPGARALCGLLALSLARALFREGALRALERTKVNGAECRG